MASSGFETATATDRRLATRRSVVETWIVTVDLAFQKGALLLDLSEEGMGVQGMSSPQVGTETSWTFRAPDTGVCVQGAGTVTWSENSGRFGVRFDALDELNRAQLARWIDQAQAVEIPPAPVFPVPDFRAADRPRESAETLRREVESRRLRSDEALAYLVDRMSAVIHATGAAIAIESDGNIVCRASCGQAPDVGAIVNPDSGLTGECIRTRDVVRCEDTETDPRVDRMVCRGLDIRSAVVIPVLAGGRMAGVIEVFSSLPYAFQTEHISLLRDIAEIISGLNDLQWQIPEAARPSVEHQEEMPAAPSMQVGEVEACTSTAAEPASAVTAATSQVTPIFASVAAPGTNEIAPEPANELKEPVAEPVELERSNNPIPTSREASPGDISSLSGIGLAPLRSLHVPAGAAAGDGLGATLVSNPAYPELTFLRPAAPVARQREQWINIVLIVVSLLVISMVGWYVWSTRVHSAAMTARPADVTTGRPAAGSTPPSAPSPTPTRRESKPRQPRNVSAGSAEDPADYDSVRIVNLRESGRTPVQVAEPATPPISVAGESASQRQLASLLDVPVPAPALLTVTSSGGVTGGRLRFKVDPVYPAAARALNLQGTVLLRATISPSGRITKVKSVSGNPVLATAASEAVRRWIYEPFRLNGKPIEMETTVTVNFNPPGK